MIGMLCLSLLAAVADLAEQQTSSLHKVLQASWRQQACLCSGTSSVLAKQNQPLS